MCSVDIYDDDCRHHGQTWSSSVDNLPLFSYIRVCFVPWNYWLLRLYQAIHEFASRKSLRIQQTLGNLLTVLDLLRLFGDFFHHWCISYWLCLRR